MPGRIGYYRPKCQAAAGTTYERTAPRQCDKNFYAASPWRKLRAAYLSEHPLCEACSSQGRTTLAEHVHHRLGRKSNPDLALDFDNLKAICQPCHNAEPDR